MQVFGGTVGRAWRAVATGGDTPTRLRTWMVGSVVVAVLFGVLGAVGVGRRDSALGAGDAASQQLIAVQDVQVLPDEVLLFRYSALTFNGHRIHYDRRYVTAIEGYPGLVVHGPLIATLLLDLLRRQAPAADLATFRFKAVRPTFDGPPLRVNGQPAADGRTVALWAQDHEGWLTMDAVATLRP